MRITPNDVKLALRSLVIGSTVENPLLVMDLLAQRVRRNGGSDSIEARQEVFRELVTSIVWNEVSRGLGESQVDLRNLTKVSEQEAIRRSFITDSPTLEAWAALYFRYLRISDDTLVKLLPTMNIPDHLLRRRATNGFEMLSRKLQQEETEAMTSTPLQDLSASLPVVSTIGGLNSSFVHAGARRRVFQVPQYPPQGVFGRGKELADVMEMMRLGSTEFSDGGVIALHGMGGIGKTTLAIALGRMPQVIDQFSDGVLWITLGPTPTPRILLEAWGDALELDLRPQLDEQTCSARLRDYLYSRQMLILVDDVWSVADFTYFLVAGPNCRTVMTTREPPIAFAIATSSRSMRVDVLSEAAALSILSRLAPDATAQEPEMAMRLCKQLDYLPLSLELAGRLLASESAVPERIGMIFNELIEQRETRLRLRREEGRMGTDQLKPVSIEAILGLSVDRLSGVDRERFAMAGLLGGEPLTWDLITAAAVWDCSETEAAQTTSTLIQRGLAQRLENRYWMHAVLADFANELRVALNL